MEGQDGGIIREAEAEGVGIGAAGRVRNTVGTDLRRYRPRRRRRWPEIATRRKTPRGSIRGPLDELAFITPHLALPTRLWSGLPPPIPTPISRLAGGTVPNLRPMLRPPVTILPLRERSDLCLPKRLVLCVRQDQMLLVSRSG